MHAILHFAELEWTTSILPILSQKFLQAVDESDYAVGDPRGDFTAEEQVLMMHRIALLCGVELDKGMISIPLPAAAVCDVHVTTKHMYSVHFLEARALGDLGLSLNRVPRARRVLEQVVLILKLLPLDAVAPTDNDHRSVCSRTRRVWKCGRAILKRTYVLYSDALSCSYDSS